MHYLPLYLQFIKLRLRIMAEYRGAFITGALAQLASYGAQFALIWIMINEFKFLGAWGPFEVMFLYALNLAAYGTAGFFFFNLAEQLPEMIRSGEFDEVLTRPLNPLLYLICREFNYGYFSHLSLSFIVIAICVRRLAIPLSILKIAFLLVTILAGALIHAAGLLFGATPAFWLVQSRSLGFLLRNLTPLIRYPISIYHWSIQVFLTLIVPYAFINFYPAQFFLRKNDFLIFHPVFQYLAPLVAVTVFALACRFWAVGVNHYESTGS